MRGTVLARSANALTEPLALKLMHHRPGSHVQVFPVLLPQSFPLVACVVKLSSARLRSYRSPAFSGLPAYNAPLLADHCPAMSGMAGFRPRRSAPGA